MYLSNFKGNSLKKSSFSFISICKWFFCFNLEPFLNRSASLPNMSMIHLAIIWCVQGERESFSFLHVWLPTRICFFRVWKAAQGSFSRYIGESAFYVFSLFGIQGTAISCLENLTEMFLCACLWIWLHIYLVSLACSILYPADLEGSSQHKQSNFLPAA